MSARAGASEALIHQPIPPKKSPAAIETLTSERNNSRPMVPAEGALILVHLRTAAHARAVRVCWRLIAVGAADVVGRALAIAVVGMRHALAPAVLLLERRLHPAGIAEHQAVDGLVL